MGSVTRGCGTSSLRHPGSGRKEGCHFALRYSTGAGFVLEGTRPQPTLEGGGVASPPAGRMGVWLRATVGVASPYLGGGRGPSWRAAALGLRVRESGVTAAYPVAGSTV